MIANFAVVIALFAFLSHGSASLFFHETFDGRDPFDSGTWIKSKAGKYRNQPVKVTPANNPATGFENDKGVQLQQEMKHYGFGSQFKEPLIPNGNVVVQYEVKLEETLNCGGAYVKLPRAESLNMADLDNSTPYTIMFGPDKCGSVNKVHFILQHQSPVTKEWEEKHFNESVPIKTDKKTHLYTLEITEDNSFEIFIDKKSMKKGNLLTHMKPAINPPKLIDDPTDEKPGDWVDNATIDDPTAAKPDDWDEDAPRKIVDVNAMKPADWNEEAPKEIPDPEAKKPDDWDDEEDGEWEAPLVPNPTCDTGCGPWTAPMINNPDYKGKWSAPKVPNPAYKGEWKPRQIDNPAYFVDERPAATMAPIGGIAVEVWTTSGGIHMDNFVVTHHLKDAFEFADSTFTPKAEAEAAKEKKEQRERREEEAGKEGFKGMVEIHAMQVVEYFTENPVALVLTILAVFVPFLYIICFGGKKPKKDAPREEEGAEAVKDSGKENEKKEGSEKEE